MRYSVCFLFLSFLFTHSYSADLELIVNGNFSNGLTNWVKKENGSSTITVSTSEVVVTVQNQTTNPWDMQLVQNGFSLETGFTYRLEVVAESPIDNHLLTGLTKDGEPYTSHFNKEISLQAGEEKTATYDFTMNAPSEGIQMSLDFGNSELGEITIKSVSLIKLDETNSWVMVWQDEFSTDGPIDQSKWSHATGGNGFGNEEAQYYSSSITNSYVSNGNLVIKAKKETIGNNDYTSAKLISQKKGDWKYGKFEIRAKLPTGKGMWPAIWMLPTTESYGQWPKSGEIDIMENVGFDPNVIHWNTHTEAYNHSIGTNKGTNAIISSPANEFHVYSIEWYENKIVFFVDDVAYFQFNKESDDYKEWPFDQEFYLILNIAVGGTWGGLEGIDDNIFPQEMLVDYVRVYESVQENSKYQLTTNAPDDGTISSTHNDGLVNAGENVTLTAIPDAGYEFVRWSGTFDGIANPINFDMELPVTMTAKFKRIGELIKNGSFKEGISEWGINTGGKADISATTDGLSITTQTTAINPWDVQVSQAPISFSAGCDYKLKVKAESNVNTQFLIGVGINETPWSSFLTSPAVLTANQEKTILLDFTVTNDNSNSRVYFDLGAASIGNLLIKEVSLTNSCLVTGISSNSTPEITVFPNPTTDDINLSKVTNWQLFNPLGVQVKEGRGNKISLKEVPSGIYFLITDEGVKQLLKK